MPTTGSRLAKVEEEAAQVMTWSEMCEMIAQIFDIADATVNPADAARFKAEVLRRIEPRAFAEYLREYLGAKDDDAA